MYFCPSFSRLRAMQQYVGMCQTIEIAESERSNRLVRFQQVGTIFSPGNGFPWTMDKFHVVEFLAENWDENIKYTNPNPFTKQTPSC